MMTEQNLTDFLTTKIPLTKLMGIEVTSISPSSIQIRAPLETNKNHMGTAFGGSLSTLMILTCYSWLFTLLEGMTTDFHIVIKDAETKYFAPVQHDLLAICERPKEAEIKAFPDAYAKKNVARIELSARIETPTNPKACMLKGTFVAKS